MATSLLMMSNRILRYWWMATAASLAGGCVAHYDWPQWRGTSRDAAWTEPGIVRALPPAGPKILWRIPVGNGWSTPIVERGRVYLTDVQLHQPKADERVVCLDGRSGKARWIFSYAVNYPDWAFAESQQLGPTATPILRDGKIYTLGVRGHLFCLNARDGRVLWKRNLEEEFQVKEAASRASPLIEGKLLILLEGGKPGKCVLALDKDTGKEVWSAVEEAASYGSPIIVNAGGTRQLIVWTQASVTSLDPRTGQVYWRLPMATSSNDANATPVFANGRLLIGGLMLKLDEDKPGASVLWPDSMAPTRRLLSNTSTALWVGDYLYAAKYKGELVCLEAATGKQAWTTNTVTRIGDGASIHLTPNGDRVFLFTDQGDLIEAVLSARGYEEFGRVKLVEPTFSLYGAKFAWAPPSFADGCVFVRTDKAMVCAELKER